MLTDLKMAQYVWSKRILNCFTSCRDFINVIFHLFQLYTFNTAWCRNPKTLNITYFSILGPPPRLSHNNIYKSIDQSYSFAGQLRRCHAHTTPGGHIGRHIRIFLNGIFSGKLFRSLSALGTSFPISWWWFGTNRHSTVRESRGKNIMNWQTCLGLDTRLIVHRRCSEQKAN